MDEATILRLIERVLDARTPAAETLTATVVGVPDTNRLMLVRIGGTDVPIPVWRPAMPTPPAEGDRVSLMRGPEGLIIVDKILDRDPVAPLLPGGGDGDEDGDGASHTLGLHTSLGLAQLTDITSHADGPGHIVTRYTPNTYDTDDGEWALMATGAVLQQFGSVTAMAFINGGGSMASTWTRGTIRFKVLQLDEFGNDPEVVLELLDFEDIAGDDVAIVVTDNSGPTTFELHVRVTREYEWLALTPVWWRPDRCQFDWLSCSTFEAAYPAGTDTTATEV